MWTPHGAAHGQHLYRTRQQHDFRHHADAQGTKNRGSAVWSPRQIACVPGVDPPYPQLNRCPSQRQFECLSQQLARHADISSPAVALSWSPTPSPPFLLLFLQAGASTFQSTVVVALLQPPPEVRS